MPAKRILMLGRKGVRIRSEAPFADVHGGGTPTPTPVGSQPRPARTANSAVDSAECFLAPLLPLLARHQSHATRHPEAECFLAPLLPLWGRTDGWLGPSSREAGRSAMGSTPGGPHHPWSEERRRLPHRQSSAAPHQVGPQGVPLDIAAGREEMLVRLHGERLEPTLIEMTGAGRSVVRMHATAGCASW